MTTLHWDHLPVRLDAQVSTFISPKSTGKRTLALELCEMAGMHPIDVMQLVDHPLTADEARKVREFDMRAPTTTAGKAVVARLTGSSEQAQNVLLKTLEEPGRWTKFYMLCEEPPLATILSRSQVVVRRGPLTPGELEMILVDRFRMTPAAADKVSGAGSVEAAMTMADQLGFKAAAMSAGQAALAGDSDLLRRALSEWNADTHRYLKLWAAESATGMARVYGPAELSQERVLAGRLSGALEASGAAPRLAASAALWGLCDLVNR